MTMYTETDLGYSELSPLAKPWASTFADTDNNKSGDGDSDCWSPFSYTFPPNHTNSNNISDMDADTLSPHSFFHFNNIFQNRVLSQRNDDDDDDLMNRLSPPPPLLSPSHHPHHHHHHHSQQLYPNEKSSNFSSTISSSLRPPLFSPHRQQPHRMTSGCGYGIRRPPPHPSSIPMQGGLRQSTQLRAPHSYLTPPSSLPLSPFSMWETETERNKTDI